MERLYKSLDLLMHSFIGVFIGHSLFVIWDYNDKPMLYELIEGNWYDSIVDYGITVAIISFICIAGKIIIKKKMSTK
ncbi:MAG: hypothetical protein ATN35_00810 [Epulopiscium sp. Nele67-Bin004]|nr:MAG: hypothetical protein ATN35_00810 [Epulopiscium sp. Nele67-Bin004]